MFLGGALPGKYFLMGCIAWEPFSNEVLTWQPFSHGVPSLGCIFVKGAFFGNQAETTFQKSVHRVAEAPGCPGKPAKEGSHPNT
jgi:hypothetical protein